MALMPQLSVVVFYFYIKLVNECNMNYLKPLDNTRESHNLDLDNPLSYSFGFHEQFTSTQEGTVLVNGSVETTPPVNLEERSNGRQEVIDTARHTLDNLYGTHDKNFNNIVTNHDVAAESAVTVRIPNTSTQDSLIDKIKTSIEASRSRPNFKPRPARLEDIDTLVDIDIRSFDSVYKDYDQPTEELRAELIQKFTRRFELLGGDWMQVVERDGKIVGFMTCCPTSKTPEEFESWEKTTDDGTLETTFDPEGENVYIVSLAMLPEGSRLQGQNMLFANQIGKMIKENYKRAFFESRLPGMRSWVQKTCVERELGLNILDVEEIDLLAKEYYGMTTEIKGKQKPQDRLIRLYTDAGCSFVKLVPNAYRDEPSMNYGAVGVFENPLPGALANNRFARNVVGTAIRIASQSHTLMQKLF